MNRRTVTTVIVTRNGKDDLLACLASLRKVTYPDGDVIVVDNASTDGTVARVREHFPGIRVMEAGDNLGFAGGNNLGITRALEEGSDYVLLLNDDTVVDPGFLEPMVELAESDPKIGAIGPRVYCYGLEGILWSAGDQGCIGKREGAEHAKVKEVPWVAGVAFFMRAEVAKKVGLLDEDLFLYAEEDEYCHRIRKAGYSMYYAPDSIVWHKAPLHGGGIKPRHVYYNSRNGVLVRRKKFGTPHFYVSLAKYLAWDTPDYALRLAREGRADLIGYLFRGVGDGLLWCAGWKRAGQNKDIKLE